MAGPAGLPLLSKTDHPRRRARPCARFNPEIQMSTLDGIRASIDETDSEIIRLLAKRQALVREASSAKAAGGLPAWTRQREEYLFKSREEMARKAGLPEGMASDIVRRVLRESYGQSGRGSYPCLAPGHCKVVIIGGNGGMGRIFSQYFESSGYEVACFGHRGWDKAGEYFKGAGIVMVTVPIDITVEIIKKASAYLTPGMILCDLTSVKDPVVKAMLECHQGPVIGLHPMFGPDVPNLVKQVVVSCSARDPGKTEFLKRQLSLWGANVVECDPKDHDEAMGIIQALRHFTTYAYGVFLSKIHPDLRKIMALSSPIYRLELMMVGRLFAQDPRLYADIIMSSDKNLSLVSQYVEALKPELDAVLARDSEAFTKRFLEARDYFGDLAGDFLRQSASILAKLQDER